MPKTSASYPYTQVVLPGDAVNPHGRTALRPILYATLEVSGATSSLAVLLDTGADMCIFPLTIAVRMGLNIASLPCSRMQGVGNSFNETYFSTVQIRVGGVFVFETYVGFTAGLDSIGLGLLGQQGFFDRHDVTFSHRTNRFTVQSVA